MSERYDAIVVGARCGGSPTAMLLARKRLPGAAGGQGHVSQRHDVHAPRPSARGGRARPLGHPRAARGHRLPTDHELLVRLRARDHLGNSAAGGRRGEGVLPPADRARRAAGRGRRRGGRRAARGLHGRGDPGGRRAGDGHPRARQGRRDGDRARPGGGGSGRQALAGGKGRAARAIQRDAAARAGLLRVLERAAGGRASTPTSARRTTAAGRPSRRTTTSPAWSRAGRSRSSRPTARTWRAPT